MLANMAGVELLPVKPGSAGKPVCGYDLNVVGPDGEPVPPNTEGAVVIRLPLAPGTLPNLWQDTARFIDSYLSPYPSSIEDMSVLPELEAQVREAQV